MISIANFTPNPINFANLTYLYNTQEKNGISPSTYGRLFENITSSEIPPTPNSTFETTNSSFGSTENFTEYAEIPYYIKATSMSFCIIIMCLGVIGNVMVPIVILKTKDMRNSTNIFLVNLSIADLMVLLVCTPTVLVEVNSKPETWVLGKELCLAVPFVELTVAHTSVLTILAISFERYYAICEPLRAGYVCTKTRATLICALAWFFAALFTSPILAIADHRPTARLDGAVYFQCLTQAVTYWQIAFFMMVIVFLYILPLIILVILYTVIAKNLITAAAKVVMNKTLDPYNARARKQVILMLGTVVLCFFICLMPYRILAIWIIITPSELSEQISPEKWYNLLYFARIMLYINSAINPILYNLMSSKFRLGFCKVCFICRKKKKIQIRTATTAASGSTTSSSLTRTTNSIKKFFNQRSLDKSEADAKGDKNHSSNEKDDTSLSVATNNYSFIEKIFNKKVFLRQRSAPECSNSTVKINKTNSDSDIVDVVNNKMIEDSIKVDVVEFVGDCDVYVKNTRSDLESHTSVRVHSLRRNVLINSAKARSIDNEYSTGIVGVNVKVAYCKSRSLDCDCNESFV